ncbi:MAG TPA: hypothetical protein VGO58_14565 [Chitinophagaceae bacterium]|jgi:hypothetical protein|nr:hypothetical protein [Chitinophagaceae bacterium]
MDDNKDFFWYERHEQNPGSINQMIKDLVIGVRHIRNIPGDKISENMPPLWAIETKLQEMDAQIGQEHREYIQEIIVALDNEPEWDGMTMYWVNEVKLNEDAGVTFVVTGESFPQRVLAEEWIKEQGLPNTRYTILEVIGLMQV